MKTKTLSPKLSKRLNDLGLLDDIETEYGYLKENYEGFNKGDLVQICGNKEVEFYKTLTESEAIEFLPSFNLEKINFKDKKGNVVLRSYNIILGDFETGKMKELIFAIEKYFEYLLDYNLLTK